MLVAHHSQHPFHIANLVLGTNPSFLRLLVAKVGELGPEGEALKAEVEALYPAMNRPSDDVCCAYLGNHELITAPAEQQ